MNPQLAAKRTRIIVLDFRNKTEHEELGRQLAEMIRVMVPETRGFEVIDRGVIGARMSEEGKRIEEMTDSGAGPAYGWRVAECRRDGLGQTSNEQNKQ